MTPLPGRIPLPRRGAQVAIAFRVPTLEIVGDQLRRVERLRVLRCTAEPFRARGLPGGDVEVEFRWRAEAP